MDVILSPKIIMQSTIIAGGEMIGFWVADKAVTRHCRKLAMVSTTRSDATLEGGIYAQTLCQAMKALGT